MKLFIRLIINSGAVFFSAYVLPGIIVDSLWYALAVAVVLGILNFLVKPLLVILTLPVTILTLGFFLFVINALIILLVSTIVPGFHVAGFLWALAFSLVFSITKMVLDALFRIKP